MLLLQIRGRPPGDIIVLCEKSFPPNLGSIFALTLTAEGVDDTSVQNNGACTIRNALSSLLPDASVHTYTASIQNVVSTPKRHLPAAHLNSLYSSAFQFNSQRTRAHAESVLIKA